MMRESFQEQTRELNPVSTGQEKHKHIAVFVEASIKCPVVLIPEDIYSPNQAFIKFTSGKIGVKTSLVPYNENIDYSKMPDERRLYDTYTLKMEQISVSIVQASK
jgi:hypothetical protein